MRLADTAYDAGNTEEALLLYNRVLEIRSRNSHAWTRKALCTAAETKVGEILAKYKEAVAYLNKAGESDNPQSKEIEGALDKIRNQMTSVANVMAAKSAESAQRFWSGDYIGGGPLYRERMQESLVYCRVALEIDPENVPALSNTAFALKKLGWLSNRKAIKELEAKLARIKAANFRGGKRASWEAQT